MKLIHDFPYSLRGPVAWPKNAADLTRIEEDGNEDTLYIFYQGNAFVRQMAPWTAEQVRHTFGGLATDKDRQTRH